MQKIKLWTRPECYIGAEWHDYYVFLGQTRDSDAATRSNFICGLEALGGESDTVLIVHESHWAVGWVEWIAIHKDDKKAIEIADKILTDMEAYPIVNDDHFTELEYNEACEYWENMSIADRIYYCKRAEISIFNARRKELPQDDSGYLEDILRGV